MTAMAKKVSHVALAAAADQAAAHLPTPTLTSTRSPHSRVLAPVACPTPAPVASISEVRTRFSKSFSALETFSIFSMVSNHILNF